MDFRSPFILIGLVSICLVRFSTSYIIGSDSGTTFPMDVQLIAIGGSNFGSTNQIRCVQNVDIISISNGTYKSGASLPICASGSSSVILNNTIYTLVRETDKYLGHKTNGLLAYDVAANTADHRSLPSAYGYYESLVAVNGSIFAFGGHTPDNVTHDYVLKYNPAQRIWWKIPEILPVAARDPCVVEYKSSIYYIVPTGQMLRSDDGAKTWNALSAMISQRQYFTCTVLPQSGLIMVAGGGKQTERASNRVELYNIKQDTWGSAEPMTRARVGGSAVTIPGTDDVAVCGGLGLDSRVGNTQTFYDDCEVYSLADNRWGFTDFKLNEPRAFLTLFAQRISQLPKSVLRQHSRASSQNVQRVQVSEA